MKTKRTSAVIAVILAILIGQQALGQPALGQVDRVRNGIIQVGMAYELSDKCSSLQPRLLRGISYLNELKRYAQAQGFSDAEIDAYVDNKAEQDRLEAMARRQLAALGVVAGREETYCRVGRAQIAEKTRVGWMLR